jgi:hypothetical protein
MKVLPPYPPDRKYIYQTDKELLIRPYIKPDGCYFMSWTEAITAYFNLPFTHEYVIQLYDAEMANKDMQGIAFVANPQGLIDAICGKGKVLFIGVKSADYVCTDSEIELGCWHKDGETFNHFTHNNGKGIVLYDPWSVDGSESVRDGKLLSKRVARLIQ